MFYRGTVFGMGFLFLHLQGASALEYGVGQQDFEIQDSARSRTIPAHLWYPIEAGMKLASQAKKPGPFLPVIAALGAPAAAAPPKFPVVLLSHGSGGLAEKLFWLTDVLVRDGIAVVAVDHPGNRTGDNSGLGLLRVWDRPRDLTLALDKALELPVLGARLDVTRAGAVGHSAGGTTALLLAGGRLVAERASNPIPNCTGTKDPYYAILCGQLKAIDLKSLKKSEIEADYKDARVGAVVALDPGFAQWFEADSLKAMPHARIFLAEKLAHPQDEIHAPDFLKSLPAPRTEVVPGTVHFTFLQACKPGFPADDPELGELCFENERKLRIQKTVAEEIRRHFRNAWSGKK